ncbi:MAG: glycosyltransferase family 2 protein [Candidatus Woesearchaeota archaeon]|nr:glycosyltransferase family 2 protein [Candidatus Woesearchaeota archaeon]
MNEQKKSPSISIIIPCYNEEKRVPPTIDAIRHWMKKKQEGYEIIIVDDGSADNTINDVKKKAQGTTDIHLLANGTNRGKGYSVRRGVAVAQHDWILIMDADSTIPIAELETFLPYLSQYKIVLGSRLKQGAMVIGQPWHRKIPGRIFSGVTKLLVWGIKDTQCGFKLMERATGQQLFSLMTIDRFAFDVELAYLIKKFHVPFIELPINARYTPESRVSMLRDPPRMLFDTVRILLNEVIGTYEHAKR